MKEPIYIGGGLYFHHRKMYELDLDDPFFGSFLEAYGNSFRRWKEKKRIDDVYVVEDCRRRLTALMKLKPEDEHENYENIKGLMIPKRRLKLCSLKVEPNDHDISGMLMALMLERCRILGIDEIYGTLRDDVSFSRQASKYMEKIGFRKKAEKYSEGIKEDVFVYSLAVKKEY